LDQEGSVLYDPEEDRIFVDALKKTLRRPIDIEEVDCNLEDIRTARALVEGLEDLMREEKRRREKS
jgi:uncharacterized protein (UPF0261 family)